MLSANSDTKLVRKGIDHGACDYLVKPVRIEELRNIWQHVIRKKKVEPKSQSKSNDQDKSYQVSGESGRGQSPTGNVYPNGKCNKKRKDEEDENDENGNDNEDPTTQKRARVVWSIELHRKFVAAVGQLGIESEFFSIVKFFSDYACYEFSRIKWIFLSYFYCRSCAKEDS